MGMDVCLYLGCIPRPGCWDEKRWPMPYQTMGNQSQLNQ